MDNKQFLIKSKGEKAFHLAMKLAFTSEYDKIDEPKQRATHYFEHKEKGLVFLDSEDKSVNSVKLPVALDWQSAASLAWTWLAAQPTESFDDWIDHDGSMGHGFKVYNEDWGYVISRNAIIAVKPIWAWYGK